MHYYEVKATIDNVVLENGKLGVAKCNYIIYTDLFAEAEQKVMEIISNSDGGEIDIVSIRRIKIDEVCTEQPITEGEDWYRAIVTIDYPQDNGSVKRNKWYMLLHADNPTNATQLVEEYLRQGYGDFELNAIERLKVDDIILS